VAYTIVWFGMWRFMNVVLVRANTTVAQVVSVFAP
jgi:hypothetical protein